MILIVAGCGGRAIRSGGPSSGTVERAVRLAFGVSATCQVGSYGTYHCKEHPPHCDAPNVDGIGGCWASSCDVYPGQTTPSGETVDVYDCTRYNVSCTSLTGGCPLLETCVVSQSGRYAVDAVYPFACPFTGKAPP